MSNKIVSGLYRLARLFGKSASIANDIETLMSGDIKKITRRGLRKVVGKTGAKTIKKINKKI